MRTSRVITQSEVEEILKLTPYDCEKLSTYAELFGEYNGKSKFHPYDIMNVPANVYGPEGKKNKNAFTTTVGQFMFNRLFVENEELFNIMDGYISDPISDGFLKSVSDKISFAVIEDRASLDCLKKFLIHCQKMQPLSNILAPGYTEAMLLVSKKIEVKKKQLLEKHKKEIEAGDEVTMTKIEKELLDYARELLKDDPSMDIYGSGGRGSWGNNFKNLFVSKGVIKDPDPSKGYMIAPSSYINGIKKEDYIAVARGMAEGPYKRGVKTQYGGYVEKLFLRAFQHLRLAPPGSDCHTKRTITVKLDKKMMDQFMYSYIVENGKLIEITEDKREKYMNKTVQLRFSAFCENDDGTICNACVGNLFYRLNLQNIGAMMPQLASALKLKSMKAFHNSVVKLHEIDVEEAFS